MELKKNILVTGRDMVNLDFTILWPLCGGDNILMVLVFRFDSGTESL